MNFSSQKETFAEELRQKSANFIQIYMQSRKKWKKEKGVKNGKREKEKKRKKEKKGKKGKKIVKNPALGVQGTEEEINNLEQHYALIIQGRKEGNPEGEIRVQKDEVIDGGEPGKKLLFRRMRI